MLLDRLLAYTLHPGGLPGMQIIVVLVASGDRERTPLVNCRMAEGSGAMSRRFSGLLAEVRCRVDDVVDRAGGAFIVIRGHAHN